jgi:hypothetical protein
MERMNGTSVGNCDSDHASQVLTVRHIDRGFCFLDPRLDESNFRLSNRLLAFLDNIAGEDSEDRKRFRYYVYGKTVACDRSYDDRK